MLAMLASVRHSICGCDGYATNTHRHTARVQLEMCTYILGASERSCARGATAFCYGELYSYQFPTEGTLSGLETPVQRAYPESMPYKKHILYKYNNRVRRDEHLITYSATCGRRAFVYAQRVRRVRAQC